jgi:hypothetical protein
VTRDEWQAERDRLADLVSAAESDFKAHLRTCGHWFTRPSLLYHDRRCCFDCREYVEEAECKS